MLARPAARSIPITVAPAEVSAPHQTGPRRPRAPVTIATRPSSSSSAAPIAVDRQRLDSLVLPDSRLRLVEHVEGDSGVAVQRPAQDATKHALELVRRKPGVTGRLEGEILTVKNAARR